MAKFAALNDAYDTVRKWAAQLRAITFEDNMQSQVRITDITNNNLLSYDGEDKLWKNKTLDTLLDTLAWTSYTPNYSASGSMTYATVTTTTAKYLKLSKVGLLHLDFSGTTGGTAGTAIFASLPPGWTLARTHNRLPIYVRDATSGVLTNGQSQVTVATGVGCYLNSVTNWGLGTGRFVSGYFVLELL